MRDEQNMENEIQAKGLTAPRLTPTLIDGKIRSTDYFVFPGTMLTVCAMTLANGFTVVGESACASPENFNKEIGEKISYENARQKIWALEGYLLRERLASSDKAGKLMSRSAANATQAGTQREIVTKDLTNDCWRNAKGDEVPTNEVVRYGDFHIRMVPDTDLGGVSGKVLGHDRSEEGAPSFKG